MTPEFQTLRLTADDRGVATLTLARPERHNAMNAQMIAELAAAADWLAAEPGLRAAVLTGEGKSFCAGADLGWMRAQTEADRAGRMAEATALARMLGKLDRLPIPLIARVQGQAYGGGLGLISVADVAVAREGARFAFTETKLGLIPATISPYVLAKIGVRARGVLFSARGFDAAEAAALGLLARAVPEEALEAAVEAEIAPYLATAPGAVARTKALYHRLMGGKSEAEIAATVEALADCWETEETAAGIAAFFEKRPPPWAQ